MYTRGHCTSGDNMYLKNCTGFRSITSNLKLQSSSLTKFCFIEEDSMRRNCLERRPRETRGPVRSISGPLKQWSNDCLHFRQWNPNMWWLRSMSWSLWRWGSHIQHSSRCFTKASERQEKPSAFKQHVTRTIIKH